jgi:hypothetical protein
LSLQEQEAQREPGVLLPEAQPVWLQQEAQQAVLVAEAPADAAVVAAARAAIAPRRQVWRFLRDRSSVLLPQQAFSLSHQSRTWQKNACAPFPLHPPQLSLSASSSP